MAKVTYKAGPGDPVETECGGRTFRHGEAVEFDGRKKEHKEFLELIGGNPFFEVDGEGSSSTKKTGQPETAEEYRAYAIDWINKAKSSSELEGRWNKEGELREKCGWGSDDQALIDPIYRPKVENMKRAEA